MRRMIRTPKLCNKMWVAVLVREKPAIYLHRESSRIEKKQQHSVYVRALITH